MIDMDEVVGLFQNLPTMDPDEQFEIAFMMLEELEMSGQELERLQELVTNAKRMS